MPKPVRPAPHEMLPWCGLARGLELACPCSSIYTAISIYMRPETRSVYRRVRYPYIYIYVSRSSEVAGFAARGLVFEVAEALLAESKAALLAEPLMRCVSTPRVPLEYSQSTLGPCGPTGVL